MPQKTVDYSLSDPRDLRFEPLNILWGGPLIVDKKASQRKREEKLRKQLQLEQELKELKLRKDIEEELSKKYQIQQRQQQTQQKESEHNQDQAPSPEARAPPVPEPLAPEANSDAIPYTVVTLKPSTDGTKSARIRLDFKNSAEKLAIVSVDTVGTTKEAREEQDEGDKNRKKSPRRSRKHRNTLFEKTEFGHSHNHTADKHGVNGDDSSIENDVSRLVQKLYRRRGHRSCRHASSHAVVNGSEGICGSEETSSGDSSNCGNSRSSSSSSSSNATTRSEDEDHRFSHRKRRGLVQRQEQHHSSLRCSSCGHKAHVYSDVDDDGNGNVDVRVRASSRRHKYKATGGKQTENVSDSRHSGPELPALPPSTDATICPASLPNSRGNSWQNERVGPGALLSSAPAHDSESDYHFDPVCRNTDSYSSRQSYACPRQCGYPMMHDTHHVYDEHMSPGFPPFTYPYPAPHSSDPPPIPTSQEPHSYPEQRRRIPYPDTEPWLVDRTQADSGSRYRYRNNHHSSRQYNDLHKRSPEYGWKDKLPERPMQENGGWPDLRRRKCGHGGSHNNNWATNNGSSTADIPDASEDNGGYNYSASSSWENKDRSNGRDGPCHSDNSWGQCDGKGNNSNAGRVDKNGGGGRKKHVTWGYADYCSDNDNKSKTGNETRHYSGENNETFNAGDNGSWSSWADETCAASNNSDTNSNSHGNMKNDNNGYCFGGDNDSWGKFSSDNNGGYRDPWKAWDNDGPDNANSTENNNNSGWSKDWGGSGEGNDGHYGDYGDYGASNTADSWSYCDRGTSSSDSSPSSGGSTHPWSSADQNVACYLNDNLVFDSSSTDRWTALQNSFFEKTRRIVSREELAFRVAKIDLNKSPKKTDAEPEAQQSTDVQW